MGLRSACHKHCSACGDVFNLALFACKATQQASSAAAPDVSSTLRSRPTCCCTYEDQLLFMPCNTSQHPMPVYARVHPSLPFLWGVQGQEGGHPSMAGSGRQQVKQAAVRWATTSQAMSRHPDLADAPLLDPSLESMEEGAPAAAPRPQAPIFVPTAIVPAVERMLQVSTPPLPSKLLLLLFRR